VNPQEAFLDLLVAAMKDAAVNRSLTQLRTQLDPDGKGLRVVRIIVVPEQMDFKFPTDRPLGHADA
jgi:hypothetical protein